MTISYIISVLKVGLTLDVASSLQVGLAIACGEGCLVDSFKS